MYAAGDYADNGIEIVGKEELDSVIGNFECTGSVLALVDQIQQVVTDLLF